MDHEIQEYLTQLQPLYEELYNRFSESYLQGCEWYVGADLVKWWLKQDKIYIDESQQKVVIIIKNIINSKKI